MINVVLVSHGDLGASLLQAAEMIAGPAEAVHSVSLFPGEAPETFGEKLEATMQEIDGEETLILVDLFGGTPYNVAVRQVLKENVECVTGANLPILLEVLMSRDAVSLAELADSVTQAGQESVKNLGPMLNRRS